MLEAVGIDAEAAGDRHSVEFSGGQCQRVSIARALMLEPKLLVCDEPVSALDVSVQAQILNLLEDLKAQMGLTMVFIAHDLAVVKHVSDRVAVMYLGKLCELAPPDVLYHRPAHPYTEALLASIPEPDPTVGAHKVPKRLSGDLPSPIRPTVRMQVPHPMPLRPATLRRGGAPDQGAHSGPVRGVPLPYRGIGEPIDRPCRVGGPHACRLSPARDRASGRRLGGDLLAYRR